MRLAAGRAPLQARQRAAWSELAGRVADTRRASPDEAGTWRGERRGAREKGPARGGRPGWHGTGLGRAEASAARDGVSRPARGVLGWAERGEARGARELAGPASAGRPEARRRPRK